MRELITIISKNFKVLLRSKTSALIILLGPLVLMLLVGIAFNTTILSNVKIGVYSDSYSELSDSIVSSLEDQQFDVAREESEIKCVEGVKTGENHVCIVLPPDLKIDETIQESENIVFHVDYSRINLVYQIIDGISSKISLKSTELSTAMTKVIVDTLESSRVVLIDNKANIDELKNKNTQIVNDVDSLMNQIPNLEVSGVNSSELSDALKQIKNMTGEMDEIDKVEAAVSSVNNAIDAITTAKDEISAKSDDIKSASNENTDKINTLQSSLNSIVDNIEKIEITQAETIVSPLRTKIEPVGEQKTHWNYLFPTLVILVTMFVAIILGSTLVIRDKSSRAYFRNFITPTNDFIFLIGIYFTALIVVFIQLLIIFAQAYYFLRAELLHILPLVGLFMFVIVSMFIFLGMLIGYLFKNEETTILGAISIAFLLLFFSNTILPIETIPPTLKVIALFNPFVISEMVLKRLILFHAPLKTLMYSLYILSGFMLVFFVVSYVLRELTKRRIR